MILLSSIFDCFLSVLNCVVSSDELVALFAGITLLGSAGIIHRCLRSE